MQCLRPWVRVAIFLAVCAAVGCSSSKLTRAQIEHEIAAQLPIGTSRAQVIAYRHEIVHSGHSPFETPDRVGAIYRDIEGSNFLVKRALAVEFRFKDGKLESYSLKEKRTGA
jgi:uncharacterized membrane-anchored protein YhcB (DUF1043 family)